MSLSRSPSPRPGGGGWSSPGLNPASASPRSSSSSSIYANGSVGPSGISWAAAKVKSDEVRGYPSFSTRNSGFFSRQKRKLSASLPRFTISSPSSSSSSSSRDYREKEKLGRGRWRDGGNWGRNLITFLGSMLRRTKIRLLLLVIILWICWLMFWTRKFYRLLLYGVFFLAAPSATCQLTRSRLSPR